MVGTTLRVLVVHARSRPLHVWLSAMVLLFFAALKLGSYLAAVGGMLPSGRASPVWSWGSISPYWLLGLGLTEFVAVLLIMFVLTPLRSCQLISTLGAFFLLYRYFNAGAPCPCMGALPSLIPWLLNNEQKVLLTVSMWLFLMGMWGWAFAAVRSPNRVVSQ